MTTVLPLSLPRHQIFSRHTIDEQCMSCQSVALLCPALSPDLSLQVVDIGLAQQLRTGTKTPQQRVVPPNRWSAAEVQQWLHHISRGCARVPKGTDGKQLVRMSEVRFVQACNGDRNMGATIFESLQEQIRMINDNKCVMDWVVCGCATGKLHSPSSRAIV